MCLFSSCPLANCSILLLAVFALFSLVRPLVRCSVDRHVVVVTGADTGFGRAIAHMLHRKGYTVVPGCLSKEAKDKYAKLSCPRMIPVLMDVTKADHCADAAAAATKAAAALGTNVKISIVNNAGISAFGFAEALPIARYEENVNVNYLGAVRATQALLPQIRASRGRVVCVGSIGDRNPSGFGSAYLASKAAMASFCECLRQELSHTGACCSLVEPGFFATELLVRGSGNGRDESMASTDAAYGSFASMMKVTEEPILAVEKLNGGPSGVDSVALRVEDALSTVLPKARYVVGWDAQVLRWVPHLPTFVVDLIFAIRVRDAQKLDHAAGRRE